MVGQNMVESRDAPPGDTPVSGLPDASTGGMTKPVYIATWREDDQSREVLLRPAELASLQDAFNGNVAKLEEAVYKRAKALGWLLDGESLLFVTAEVATGATGEAQTVLLRECIYLRFAFCPAADPEQRRRNLKQRKPDWIEVDRNRLLTYISMATLILVVIQLALLLWQNAQFDEALRQFKTVVQAYLWQVNTPALGANYLSDTGEIELMNYGQTYISLDKAVLSTSTGESPLKVAGGTRLKAGESARISTSPQDIGGPDIVKGVEIRVVYVYLGHSYQLVWPATVRFKGNTPYIEPVGEYTVAPIQR